MHILFDKGSSQVQVQLETGKRLNTLFAAIEQQGWTHAIGPDRIDRRALEGVDCLAIFTRHRATQPGTTNPFPDDWDFAYTKEELHDIVHFVEHGGGLVLISNHGPFQKGDVNWTEYDKELAKRFDVEIHAAAYQKNPPPLTMSGSDFGSQPCVLDGVTSIVPHNSCAVRAKDNPPPSVISRIPPNATNSSPIFPDGPAGQNYAVIVDGGKHKRTSKVIVAGNSGIAGDPGSNYPAPGMIDAGSNKQFLLNALRCSTGK